MNAPRLAQAALAAMVSVLLAGCGDETPAPTTGAFVGTVEGTDAVIGASIEDGSATFYLCGGGTTYDHATRWFTGEGDGTGAIELEKDGWQIRGDLVSGTGTLVTPEGVTASWGVQPTTESTLEGLYAVVDEGGCRTGVVVAADDGSDAPVVQGTWCDGSGRFAQITPILPIVLTANSFDVLVNLPEGVRTLNVKRVGAQK